MEIKNKIALITGGIGVHASFAETTEGQFDNTKSSAITQMIIGKSGSRS